ncbi:MAG: glucosyl-3-phosphoglycerate synthase [Actinobacteria bacterium]|nr:glucosyl-3-phosphoglycerate synthase [Actinomycetota bacterium]
MAVENWRDRTFRSPLVSRDDLLRLKQQGGHRITAALPALDEAATIGPICDTISRELMERLPIVDELLVIDSGSADDTIQIARAAGATVFRGSELTQCGPIRGKGDCLWRSLAVASGDIIVWLDSDTRNLHEGFIVDLIAPLLVEPRFVMTKAFYDRPLIADEEVLTTGGARVTELVARPLFQLFYPDLVGLIQPLSGEYAGYTDRFRSLPFFTGYGVEVGLLLDVAERFGVDAIAQVDLGVRLHRNRSVLELGQASFQVMSAMLRRLHDLGRIKIPDDLTDEMLQFMPTPRGPEPVVTWLEVLERPPLDTL